MGLGDAVGKTKIGFIEGGSTRMGLRHIREAGTS